MMRRVWHRDGHVIELEVSHCDTSYVARLGVYQVIDEGGVEQVVSTPHWADVDVRSAKQNRSDRMLRFVREIEDEIEDGKHEQLIYRLAK